MKPRLFVVCPIIFFITWLPIVAYSLSHEAPEAPFASDQTSDQLVLLCGFPGEFDPVQPVSPAPQKHHATFSSPINMQDVETTASTQVPEPSTLVLLGLGVIGLITFVRRKRKTI